MKIGIFGGSFNPIHTGHVALAQAVLKQCELDEVWLMVSPLNPLKRNDSDLLDDSLRYQLARKALEGINGVKACDYEFRLPKPSYTWNTLQQLSKDFPDHRFCLLIGGDNWAHFERWRHCASAPCIEYGDSPEGEGRGAHQRFGASVCGDLSGAVLSINSYGQSETTVFHHCCHLQ